MEHIYIQTPGKDSSLELASKKHWKQGCVWDLTALHDRPILLHVSSLSQNIYSLRNRIIFTLFHQPWRASFSPVFCIQGSDLSTETNPFPSWVWKFKSTSCVCGNIKLPWKRQEVAVCWGCSLWKRNMRFSEKKGSYRQSSWLPRRKCCPKK